MYDPYKVRPDAFFSETTWYGLYSLLGLVLFDYLFEEDLISRKSFFLYLIFIGGIVLSASRSMLIVLFLLFLSKIYAVQTFGNYKQKKYFFKMFLTSLFTLFLFYPLYGKRLSLFIDTILYKFTLQDASGQGRLLAFEWSFNDLRSSLFFGKGYNWNSDEVTTTGTFLGAKSFNIFFQVGHIFGVFGLIIFLIALLYFLSKLFRQRHLREKRLAISLFVMFIVVAMFTPIHQYPPGIAILGLCLAIASDAKPTGFEG